MQTQYPPGPRDGFFGLIIGLRSLREPLTFLQEIARRYGDMAHIHVGPLHSYLINHPNLVREVLVAKGKSSRKWERQKRVFRKIDGEGLINSEGEFWLRQRRLIQKAFQHRRLGRSAEMMVELTRRRLDRWTAGAAIDLDREMSELALEITGETLFGVNLRDQAAWLGETLESQPVRQMRRNHPE